MINVLRVLLLLTLFSMLPTPLESKRPSLVQQTTVEPRKENPLKIISGIPGTKLDSIMTMYPSIYVYATRASVDALVVAAMIDQESGGDSLATNPNDPSYGLGGIMPEFWSKSFVKQCGGKATPTSLLGADLNICYTSYIFRHFLIKMNGDYYKAIAAYNNGTGAPSSHLTAVRRKLPDDYQFPEFVSEDS